MQNEGELYKQGNRRSQLGSVTICPKHGPLVNDGSFLLTRKTYRSMFNPEKFKHVNDVTKFLVANDRHADISRDISDVFDFPRGKIKIYEKMRGTASPGMIAHSGA